MYPSSAATPCSGTMLYNALTTWVVLLLGSVRIHPTWVSNGHVAAFVPPPAAPLESCTNVHVGVASSLPTNPNGRSTAASRRSRTLVAALVTVASGSGRMTLFRSIRVVYSYGWLPAQVSGAPSTPEIADTRSVTPNNTGAGEPPVRSVTVASGAPPPDTAKPFDRTPCTPGSTVTYTYIRNVSSGATAGHPNSSTDSRHRTTGAAVLGQSPDSVRFRPFPPSFGGSPDHWNTPLCTVTPAGRVSVSVTVLASIAAPPASRATTSYASQP